MKKTLLVTAILAMGAVASQAVVIDVLKASNTDQILGTGPGWVSLDGGATTGGTYTVSTQITDGAASGSALVYTLGGLNIDGGNNDEVVINFTVTTSGGTIDTKTGSNGSGWLSDIGATLNSDGEFLQIDFTSLSVNLNGGTGNGSGSFDGFTAASLGSWAIGHTGTVNSVQQGFDAAVLPGENRNFDLTGGGNDANLKATYTVADGDAGSYRPENWSFQVTAVPEPATLGLVTAFGAGILFIRRRLQR